MGSTALTLVNDVLLLTGDNNALETISGSVGSIGERIVGFMNLVISDMEKRTNWPELRADSQGTADGVNDTYAFSGSEDVRADSAVSVWIDSLTLLDEVSPEQYDIIVASQQMTGRPQIFQRKSGSGKLQVQIHPMPESGDIINVTAYKRATRFTTSDTSTTELDDDIIKYGTLMHMDAYAGQQRGYATLYKNALDDAVGKLYSNSNYQVMVESYA
jgi:hypothetical protein